MKKIYLSALSLAVATGLNAQIVSGLPLAPKNGSLANKTAPYANANQEKASIWSNDVSDPTEWTFTNTSSPAQDWYVETNPASVPTFGPVTTTTAANGFLMIDSDGAGSAALQNAYATYNGVLDFTGQPYVTLEFEHHFRAYQEERSVEISIDGGNTWIATYEVTSSAVANVNVSETFSINISSVVGNESNVTFRFHYVGAYGWYWAVDDINMKETEQYDLRADKVYWGVASSWAPYVPYFLTPTTQIDPVTFCGINTNVGVNDVADATYNVAIPSAAFLATGTLNSVSGATDTICTSTGFTPAGVGSYTATSAMTTSNPDTGPNNNTFEDVSFDVSQYIYARDNGVQTGFRDNGGLQFEIGNSYDIFNDQELTGIVVGIDDQSEVGASVYGRLYTVDVAGDFQLLDQTFTHTLTSADISAGTVTLALVSGGYMLIAGEAYMITAGSDGDGGISNDLVVQIAGDSEGTPTVQTSFFYNPSAATGPWFYTTGTSVVRMTFDPVVGIEENANVFGMGVYPNPTNADATVSFALNNAADVNITVTDLSGKVVYSNALGNVAAGTTEVSLNTASLTNGMYMINVAADNAVSTERLVINK